MNDAQNIHRLERQLADCEAAWPVDVTAKINLLNDLAWALCDTDLKRAQSLSETAYILANSPHEGQPPDRVGLAYSLRTQGYLNQRLGDYPLGLSQLLQAQELFESLQLEEGLPDVFDGLAGIYFQIGIFPEAFDYAHQQLEAARRSHDKARIANAYNNLACLYSNTGDLERSLEAFHHNLEIAAEIGHPRIESLSYMNLADTYTVAGNYEKALEYALAGLKINQQSGFQLFEVYSFNNIGEIYLKLGQTEAAVEFLQQALKRSEKLESQVTKSIILLNLGQAYCQQQQFEPALAFAKQALAQAQAIEARSDLYQSHLLLSEIYEQQGDLAQALAHYKQSQTHKEAVLGDKSDQRLKVLQVAYDTEAAKTEAEILQLKTVELQREVNERLNAEMQVQHQLDYVRALSACSQTLLAVSGSQADNQRLMSQALRHLLKPAQASKIFLYENFNHPELGFSSRFMVDACAPGIPSLLSDPDPNSQIIPWSIAPDENRRRLAAGEPVGGPVKTLFASTPAFRDYLLNQVQVLSVQFFPIHFGDDWWGYVGFDDRAAEREWSEEEVLLLVTTAEMLSSTLQRWQVEEELRKINDRLEQQVKLRTGELNDTIALLKQEINEREQAEAETQRLLATLEQRVAARTEELATFFDLTVLAGHAANLTDVFQQATPRILEVTRSRVICIHLLEADRPGLRLAAQQNLPGEARPLLQGVEPPPNFQPWLQQPNDPLMTTTLSTINFLPPAFRLKEFQSYLGAQIRVGEQVKGLLSCYRFTERGFSLDEISLVAALAEQIGMVLETHRLRQVAGEVAVLEERQRLARELHDSVTQAIYSLTLFARSSREAAEDGDLARLTGNLQEIETSALQTLHEMRLLLYELRAPLPGQEGLAQALETRLNLVERRAGLQVAYQADLLGLKLSQTIELELYRLAIEALNNIIKHANAREITLDLQAANGQVYLKISDDGCGFDPKRLSGGFGLQGMQERVARLGGALKITSAPGQGTKISIEVGLTQLNAQNAC